jgi:hypothetical protein
MAAPIAVKSYGLLLLQKYSCKEMQQLILGIGNANCWVIEPYCSTTVQPPLAKANQYHLTKKY